MKPKALPVVILCGGKGTRLKQLTEDIPKPLIEVGGRPILWHIMRFFAHQGHREFILCLGYKGESIKRWFMEHQPWEGEDFTLTFTPDSRRVRTHAPGPEPWTITFADTGEDTNTGGRIKRVERYIKGRSFLATYGDGLSDVDLPTLIRYHQKSRRLATLTAVRPASQFVNYLAVSVPLSLCACWGQVRPRVLVLGIASALLVGAWTLSNGYAGLLVGMLLVCWRHWYPPSKLRTGVLGVFALGTAGAAAVLVFASIAAQVPAGTGDTRLGSVDIAWTGASRPSVWRAAFKTFSEHPVSGLGYGRPIAFVSDPRAWVPAAKLARLHGPVPGEWLEAHNTWLNIAAQAGILGLVAFIVLLLSLWRPVWALAKAGTEPASRLAAALLAAFAGAVLFHGLFAALEEARHLWALMALASSVVLVFQLTPATADSSPPGSS